MDGTYSLYEIRPAEKLLDKLLWTMLYKLLDEYNSPS